MVLEADDADDVGIGADQRERLSLSLELVDHVVRQARVDAVEEAAVTNVEVRAVKSPRDAFSGNRFEITDWHQFHVVVVCPLRDRLRHGMGRFSLQRCCYLHYFAFRRAIQIDHVCHGQSSFGERPRLVKDDHFDVL